MSLLIIFFFISMVANMGFAARLVALHAKPLVKVEYKEIEVVKKAMCECGHISSMHNARGCRQELFILEGRVTSESYRCFCVKYTGPVPFSEYYDDKMNELETHRA